MGIKIQLKSGFDFYTRLEYSLLIFHKNWNGNLGSLIDDVLLALYHRSVKTINDFDVRQKVYLALICLSIEARSVVPNQRSGAHKCSLKSENSPPGQFS